MLSGDSNMILRDDSIARDCHPPCPSSAQSLLDVENSRRNLDDEADILKGGVVEDKLILQGAAERQGLADITNMEPSRKSGRQAFRAWTREFFERNEKLKAFIFESQVFSAQAAWRAQELLLQTMDPELRKTCEQVAHVRQVVAQLEAEAAIRRSDKLQVELDEAKEKLSSLAATEQQLRLELADCTAQLEDARKRLQQVQAEKDEIAAIRQETAVSQAELRALHEQLHAVSQQQVVHQQHYTAAATTTAVEGTPVITPSTADLELMHAPNPFTAGAIAAASEMLPASVRDETIWKEVNDIRAQLVEVKTEGRDTAERLRAVDGKCDVAQRELDVVKSTYSTPANRIVLEAVAAGNLGSGEPMYFVSPSGNPIWEGVKGQNQVGPTPAQATRGPTRRFSSCERQAPAARPTPSTSPRSPASGGVVTRGQTRACKGLFSPPEPFSGKMIHRDDSPDGNGDDATMKRPRTN
ncbi:hypothetical protein VaNZ11_001248 [Volvox africanus]|uniref:Uncharacterized protein n=1 Tax=Volvox africanus TaxID=51714 RepID=A0ABQ5RPA0_9CHLO|nr:hypothetical protein VaNZ11_001248 [Volvox africanus]